MEWKKRLLVEYADLKEKMHRLNDYLSNNIKTPDNKKVIDLMEKQFEGMEIYLRYLEERILLLMGE